MDYLVTGGAGFIGSNIVRHLVGEGASVRVLDDLSTGKLENIAELGNSIDFVEGDIRNTGAVQQAVSGVTNVLHVAALPSVPRSVEDPVTSNEVNVLGTLSLLVSSRDAGVRSFVFSSSSSVYGDTEELPKREDMIPNPLSPYAVQKLTGEHYCRVFRGLYGLRTFALRYFNVFGPRQDPQSQYAAVIPKFIDAIGKDEPPTIHGDGGQTRDFTYVDNIVAANISCCDAPDEAAGTVYNAARGDRISVNELAMLIMKRMGKNIEPVHVESRPGDVRDSQADSSRAARALGWSAQVQFEEGLGKTVEYFTGSR